MRRLSASIRWRGRLKMGWSTCEANPFSMASTASVMEMRPSSSSALMNSAMAEARRYRWARVNSSARSHTFSVVWSGGMTFQNSPLGRHSRR